MRFYQVLSDYYDIIFPFSGSKKQFFEDLIDNNPPGSALDLGCATGGLVGFLTRLGWDAEGVDLSPELISLARANNSGTFYLEDMLLFLERTEKMYDLIVCIGNTLPHLPKDNLKDFIGLTAKRLRSGGKLILQTVNYHKILADRPLGLPTIKNVDNEVVFTRLYDYNMDGSITFSSVLETPLSMERSSVTLWPFTYLDFRELLKPGLIIDGEYGSFAKEVYDPKKSPAWVIRLRNK